MRIGQEGDTRKFRRLKKSDYYEAKAAVDQPMPRWEYCKSCGQRLDDSRKNWNGYCFKCFNEP